MSRLLDEYRNKIRPSMMKKFGYTNINRVPKVEKVVVNVGVGDAVQDPKIINVIREDLSAVTGLMPQVRKARKAIASFHLRKGMPIGLRVTLRGKRAYDFLDRLVNFAAPRIRDFRGFSLKSFDGRGNYNIGIADHTIFPEIDIDKVKKIFGMDINIVTTAKTDEEAKNLLEAFGFPFERRE